MSFTLPLTKKEGQAIDKLVQGTVKSINGGVCCRLVKGCIDERGGAPEKEDGK